MRKVTIRVPESLYLEMKERVERGEAESISAIVRDALEFFIEKYSKGLGEGE